MNHSVIYASSYDRGLVTLLDMWPQVRELVPTASLSIFYGWDSFDAVHKQNPEMMKFKWQIIRKLHELKGQGVTEHGRVDHQELAREFKKHKVLAYPTEFTEIFMITMTKALMAGLIPVTTGLAAIKETQGGFGYTVECDDISTNAEKQKEFVETVAKALNQTDYDATEQKKFAASFDWTNIAAQWEANLA